MKEENEFVVIYVYNQREVGLLEVESGLLMGFIVFSL